MIILLAVWNFHPNIGHLYNTNTVVRGFREYREYNVAKYSTLTIRKEVSRCA